MNEYVQQLFKKYDISYDNGFIPQDNPLEQLPHYFKCWDDIVYDLVSLNKEKRIRQVVDEMPLLDYTKLESVQEYQRAYLILSMICHSYVWAHGSKHAAKSIPPNLAIPFTNVSKKLDIVPVMTHAGLDLFNWKLVDKSKDFCLDNLRCIHTVTGTFDEEWFYLVITAIEKEGAEILKSIVKFNRLDESEQTLELTKINNTLQKINDILTRVYQKCDPDVFWYKLRPYLAGWENNDNLPDGLIYEGVSPEPIQYAGGSAAQSSLFPSIDAAFNVHHHDDYFQKIQRYMPGKHKEFIAYVKRNIRIDQTVKKCDNAKMTNIFNDCLKKLEQFRQIHMGIVYKYIIRMAKKDAAKEKDEEKEKDEDKDKEKDKDEDKEKEKEKKEKGTGGTDLIPFLRGSIKETNQANL